MKTLVEIEHDGVAPIEINDWLGRIKSYRILPQADAGDVKLSDNQIMNLAQLHDVRCETKTLEFARAVEFQAQVQAMTQPATPSSAEAVAWLGLSDSDWVNIVNHDHAYEYWTKDDAINIAVKLTEAKLKELNAHSTPVAQTGEQYWQQQYQQDIKFEREEKELLSIELSKQKKAGQILVDAIFDKDKELELLRQQPPQSTPHWHELQDDTLDRLHMGVATEGDQLQAFHTINEAQIYSDIYWSCADKLEPFIEREYKLGHTPLPACITDSLDIVIDFWIKAQQQPPQAQKAEGEAISARMVCITCGRESIPDDIIGCLRCGFDDMHPYGSEAHVETLQKTLTKVLVEREEWRSKFNSQPAASAVPDGYVLVPIEPTDVMQEAGFDIFAIDHPAPFPDGSTARRAIWQAMIAAALAQSEQGEG